MPQYDLKVMLSPNLDPAQVALEKDQIQAALERHKATVKNLDEWGSRRLAYPIEKDREGYFLMYTVELDKEAVNPLEKELLIRDNVRRVMIVRERQEAKVSKRSQSQRA